MTHLIDRKGLIAHLCERFSLDWHGDHGIAHWARVRVNGLMLAKETGANKHVVELFSFFHDARRVNEHDDHGHGNRGAILAKHLKGRYFDATDLEMDLLEYACRCHSDGKSTGDMTVLTCWDADRLDLGRVGITPDPRYLCTDVAKRDGNLQQAHARALAWKEHVAHRKQG
jgi:uncharacterized protein